MTKPDQETCSHADIRPQCLISKCEECDAVFYTYFQHESQRIAELLLKVRQGLVPLAVALMSPWLTEADRALLAGQTTCGHPAEKREKYHCNCEHVTRERCTECLRVFTNPADFILDHEEKPNGS